MLFSIEPLAGDAYVTLYEAGRKIAYLGRLQTVESLTVVKRDGDEGLEMRFVGDRHEPLRLQTEPEIRLSWDVATLGTW